MTAPISESWTRIENWLAEHASATYAALAPPADPADIAAVERVIGRPLLKPLVMSLLRHDGLLDQRGSLLPGFYRLMSAREIAAAWQLFTGFYDKRTADEKGEEADYDFMKIGASFVLYGHPQLIPIARNVGGVASYWTIVPRSTGGASTKPRPWKALCAYHTRCGRPCRCSWRRSPRLSRPTSPSTATRR